MVSSGQPLENETASVLLALSFSELALQKAHSQKEFTQEPNLDTELLTTRISSAWAEEPTSRPRHDSPWWVALRDLRRESITIMKIVGESPG